MLRWLSAGQFLIVATISGLSLAPRAGAEVDLLFDPPMQTVLLDEDDTVEINLVAHSADRTEQFITALDAILVWDPTVLELLGVDDSDADVSWFVFGFLPDPDGINEGISDPPIGVPDNDGDAIFTALAPPDSPASTGPDDIVITTLLFRALQPTSATVVQFLPAMGNFGHTRVFGKGKQNDITGDISATATVVIVQGTCFADFDHNGQVDAFDLAVLLGNWGPCQEPCVPGKPSETCPADLDPNCNVSAFDLALLLGAWGPCP